MTRDKQVSTIKKELISLITYPYSDPSPIPEFGRLYPYNRFDGYAATGHNQEWEMIVMENEYLKLWINPAVGGKVWGAIEKSTSKEFIYFNHAAKFRDVAMRGPWTSGGMETNMGIIGHTPSCSSAVDHSMCTNADGSVSCFVGATDWPSRTSWMVEVRLPADAAYFITKSSWYNGSGLEQSYYQWNNIGIRASGNLEYINPGHQRLGHDGKSAPWPMDEHDKSISFYDQNDFGEYKSYHIVGSYSDFWGCYWHQDDFGLGHSAAYDEKPGKKIWIWGLSRYGMIWEKLLTDTDGQYTELQSGRLFNQSISSSSKTPFKHSSFLPYTFDSWNEYWFPVKNIGGLIYGNRQLSFNLTEQDDASLLKICANQDLNHLLKIEHDHKLVLLKDIELDAMQTATFKLPAFVKANQLKVWLNDALIYSAADQNQPLSRPLTIPKNYNFESVQGSYIQAKEWERQRFYERAVAQYRVCLQKDPFYIEALNGLAGILIKQKQYKESLRLLKIALSVDTYHPEANYLYGTVNSRLSALNDAKDGFSIASQSLAYRSAAYTELARLLFREQQYAQAMLYINKALLANGQNQQALQLAVIANRLQNNTLIAKQLANKLLLVNPLDHLARFELCQLGFMTSKEFKQGITSELPYETHLELNTVYLNLGLYYSCLDILALSPGYAMVSIYTAFIFSLQNAGSKAEYHISVANALPPQLVFPHREEDVTVLEWAVANYPSWKLNYYLALGYTQMLRKGEAFELLSACKNEPDFYVFYITRANLQRETNEQACEDDLQEAYRQAPQQWRTALLLSKYLGDKNRWADALSIVQESYLHTPDNYYLGLQLANCFMHTAAFEEGIALMNSLDVLPNEGALEGRNTWKETNLHAALKAIQKNNWTTAIDYIDHAREWPENLGVGKPYDVDERLEDFLALYCLQQKGSTIPDGLAERLTLYRDKFPGAPYCANDFLSMYLLRQNNLFDKAQQLLNNWLQHNAGDIAAQWSAAFIDGNVDLLEKIALIPVQKQQPLPYEILFEDRSFPFIKAMYQSHIFKISTKPVNDLMKFDK